MYKTKKTKKGFSIGEVMIAMFILVVGIIGAVFLSAQSTAQIGDSRNAIIAASLAQEGIELVRNIRDNSVTQMTCGAGDDERCTAFEAYAGVAGSRGQTYGWPSLVNSGADCIVDYAMQNMTGMDCDSPSGLEQLYLTSNGFYTHDSGSNLTTPFKRVVYIDYYDITTGSSPSAGMKITDKNIAAKVTSVVTWSNDVNLSLDNATEVEQNCKIGKQCAYAQTTLTSWINYGE